MLFRLVIASALFLLAACSDAPDTNSAKSAFQGKIASEVKGTSFTLQSFEKADGQTFEAMGVKGYRFFYRAAVAFPDGYHPECVQNGNRFAGFDCGFAFGPGQASLRPQPRGATVNYSGTMEFQRTENGWQFANASFTEGARTVTDDTQKRFSVSEPDFIRGQNWGPESGYVLLFESPNIYSKKSAADISLYWKDYLEKEGVTSYKLMWHNPNRLLLCIQGQNDSGIVKNALVQNSPGAGDIRVIAELTFRDGVCNYEALTPH